MDYTWDLTKLIKDEKEFDSLVDKTNELLSEIEKYKGKITKSSKNLFMVLSLSRSLGMISEKLYVYSHLGFYENMASETFINLKNKSESLCDKVSSALSFINPELLSVDYSLIDKYIKENKDLALYERDLKETFRYKSHILSAQEEKILSDVSEALRTSDDAYEQIDNVDIKFDQIKNEKGEYVDLTPYNYSGFLISKEPRVRKEAFLSEYKYYREHINTISALYIGRIKTDGFYAKTKKYNSILESKLYSDNISPELYKKLIEVTDKNIKYLNEYYKIKEKELGTKLHMYDLYLNTSKVPEKKIEYSDGIKLVNEALEVLGEDYLTNFNRLLNTRCVDVYPKDKKRSGAYQWGTYGTDPYVSLNYEKNVDDVSTLAHEMGHAMHSYYSDKNQDYIYAGYPIFLAEIASTVNEVLLSNYEIKNSESEDEKDYYIIDFLDKFKATVYRQVMFAEFEYEAHKMYEEGKSLTKDSLCNLYYELNKKHFGDVIEVDDDIRYEWARIPHFYTPFYVYKYATGFITALLIADKLEHENNFKDKYINFLSSGGSKYPLELLEELGIDLTKEETLQKAFDLFEDKVKLLKK